MVTPEQDWTPDTVLAHVDSRIDALEVDLEARISSLENQMNRRFDAQDKATRLALADAEKAVLKTESISAAREEEQSKWRLRADQQIHEMTPREEYVLAHTNLVDLVAAQGESLSKHLGEQQGEGSTQYRGYMIVTAGIAALAVVLSFIALVLMH